MRLRALGWILPLAVVAFLVATGRTKVVVAVAIALVVLAGGRAVFRGYARTRGPTGPATDVAEEGTLLVFACEVCGEQLVLLRKGTDQPPRHCSEKMVLRRIPAGNPGVN